MWQSKNLVSHTDPYNDAERYMQKMNALFVVALSITAISCKKKVWTRCRLHEEEGGERNGVSEKETAGNTTNQQFKG